MVRFSTLGVVAAFLVSTGNLLSVGAADKASPPASPGAPSATLAEAREHLQQALLAENRGDNEERSRQLSLALAAEPNLPEANWHTARVQVGGEWLPLAQAVSRTSNDPLRAKYRALRDKAGSSPRALRDLARFCQKNGWDDVARLHYAQLVGLPSADIELKQDAIKALGWQQVNGAWLTQEEVEARRAAVKAVEQSLKTWRPNLQRLQPIIDGENYAARDKAIAELHKLADPQIIPALESMLPESGDRFSEEAVKLLAKFPHYEATQALARYAVLSNYALTREAAIAELRQRPRHDYVPLLLAGLVAPLQSQYQVTWDSRGRINYVHAVMETGPSLNRLLVSQQSATMVVFPSTPPGAGRVTVAGLPPAVAFATERESTLQQAENAETQVRLANSQVDAANSRCLGALAGATGEKHKTASDWWSWWRDYNEYSWPRPTQYVYRSNPYVYYAGNQTYSTGNGSGTSVRVGPGSNSIPNATLFPRVAPRVECFVAGTPVRTQSGQVPIESIQPGDRVLAQDQDTGELAYKVVLTTTVRQPGPMLAIGFDDEKIVTTPGHPLWVVGHGWKMAKELKEGDLLHRLGGAVKISSIATAPESAAHNLVVDDFNSYFVGQAGVLAHDNEFRKPTRAVVPGLILNE